MTGIYQITNTTNNKKYIGQSVNITDRWREHRKRANYSTEYLYQAMRKYGISNFVFEVLEECLVEELNDKERY